MTSLRLDWRHAPLSDVFLVFTARKSPLGALENSLVVKATRTLAW